MDTINLASGGLEVRIAPWLGGGIARFDIKSAGELIPVLRPWPGAACVDPLRLGMIILAPWQNRISGGGFMWRNRFRPLAPNLPERTPYPVHGNAFQLPWRVGHQGRGNATLRLSSNGPGPFAYEAKLDYALDPEGLTVTLALQNTASEALPYGLGFHPWFAASPGFQLEAPAVSLWPFGPDGLPARKTGVDAEPDLDFRSLRPVPDRAIACWMTGWRGNARLFHPAHGLEVTMEASPELAHLVLFSPGPDAGFLCVEPVTHGVDAHNRGYGPEDGPLIVLERDETLTARIRISARRVDLVE